MVKSAAKQVNINYIYLSLLAIELKKLETRPTTRPATKQPTAQPPPTILTPSEMFLPYSPPPTHASPVTKRFCAQGMFFYDVKLRNGWNAGMLLQATRVDSMTECIQLCCDEPACDFVMLKERKCYTVRCKGGDTCTVEEGGNYQISFVSRQGKAWFHFSLYNKANYSRILIGSYL